MRIKFRCDYVNTALSAATAMGNTKTIKEWIYSSFDCANALNPYIVLHIIVAIMYIVGKKYIVTID